MMILCRTFHSLLGFTDPHHSRRVRYAPPPDDAGGGLRFLAGGPPDDGRRVVDSSSVGPSPPPPEAIPDPGSWGLHEVGGGIGLCTENLGSESSCDDVAAAATEELGARSPRRGRRPSRRSRTEQRKRSFPPPLPWLLESNGRRNHFMKGERRDGRFLLREVRIERPEVMRAERRDGRLRLHMIESEEEEVVVEEVEVAEEVAEEVAAEVEERREEKWEVVGPVGSRCQEEVSGNSGKCMQMWWGHHHHHHHHHRFVTTA